MALYDDTNYRDSPRIDDELQHTVVNYGEPYVNTLTWQNLRTKTLTTMYKYRRLFLNKAGAEALVADIQEDLDTIGNAYSPPRVVGNVKAKRSYKCDGFDVEVNYADSVTTVEPITE